MKVIIAGSRTITNQTIVNRAILVTIPKLLTTQGIIKIEIVSGGAIGVDELGERWARGFNYPIKMFIPNWKKYGKKAGYLRNIEMANYADALIAIWDGKSKGTKMMIDIAKKKGLKVYIYKVENDKS